MEHKEEHLTILLDIQKQLGTLGAETARQSEVLKRIDTQVQKTNGRVTSLETDDNYRKGKLAVIGAIAGGIASVIIGLLIKYFGK